jgi:heme O synthase-like polyprenyltransferase
MSEARAASGNAKVYVELARPFTLLPPALGVLSGAASAWGAGHARPPVDPHLLVPIVLGALMAAVLNAANNAINQIYDLDIDRVNKPKRPLPRRALTLGQAWASPRDLRRLLGARLVRLARRPARVLRDRVFTTFLCWVYSAPPLWTKRRGFLANITIAIPRGVLLKVAGWSTVKTVFGLEPWYIGAVFGLFLLGPPAPRTSPTSRRPRGGLPHPAHRLRSEGRRLDHRALLRASVLPDPDRRLPRDPDREQAAPLRSSVRP